MRRFLIPIVVASFLGGCSTVGPVSPSAPPSAAGPSIAASAGPSPSEIAPPVLPIGFPVLPSAVAVPLPPDDAGLIGLWESDEPGSAAYDFYASALPAAGYPLAGLYPGGAVALIRFWAGDEVWQMVAHGAPDGGVQIEIRLDRP